jgi:hypothetical protein
METRRKSFPHTLKIRAPLPIFLPYSYLHLIYSFVEKLNCSTEQETEMTYGEMGAKNIQQAEKKIPFLSSLPQKRNFKWEILTVQGTVSCPRKKTPKLSVFLCLCQLS